MSVAKRYNAGTSQWEPFLVGKQGPVGPAGGFDLSTASIATISLTGGPVYVRAPSDPLVDPEAGIYGESFGFNDGYDADLWTWSDPDGIFQPVSALTNWSGRFTAPGSYMIQTTIEGPYWNEQDDMGYWSIGVYSIDPEVGGGPTSISTSTLTYTTFMGTSLIGKVTSEYVASPLYTEFYQEFGYQPATVGSSVTIYSWITQVYFWPTGVIANAESTVLASQIFS